jgi:hypothetical protein
MLSAPAKSWKYKDQLRLRFHLLPEYKETGQLLYKPVKR